MTELSRNWDAQSSLFTWAGPWWSVAAGGTEAAAEPVVSERFVSLERREGMVVVVLLLLGGGGGRGGQSDGRVELEHVVCCFEGIGRLTLGAK